MRKIILILLLSVGEIASMLAHGGGFLERCDKIGLPDCTYNWNAITSTDSALYLVGAGGYCFIYYHSGGLMHINTGTSDALTGVQFLTNTVGYAWGKNGTLIKTSDAGLNWSSIATNTTENISKVEFLDENNAYLMVSDTIKCTVNGGANWDVLSLPPSVTYTDFHFFNAQNGQICGQQTSPSLAGFLYKTTDGGSSWNLIYNDTCAFTKLFYTDETNGYLYGTTINEPILLESTNSGTSWAGKYTSTAWNIASDVVAFNGQPVFISNEATGKYLYNIPYFLDLTYGTIANPISIYSSNIEGVESLYVICSSGLYRYTTGNAICKQLNFAAAGVTNDTSNMNNIMAPGRKVRFKALLFNTTLDTIQSVDGRIRCNSPYVTITDSIATYNDVLPNTGTSNSAWCGDWYEIELANNIPNNYVIHLEFFYENRTPTNGGSQDRSIIDFPFLNSPFTVTGVTIVDTATENTFGDGDGIIEPTETAEIITSVKNVGGHYMYGVTGKIATPFSKIEIWNNHAKPNGSGVVYNTYSIGSFNPNQTMIPVGNYVVTDTASIDYKIPFTLILVGTISSFNGSNGCNYSEYFNINYCWGADFNVNNGFPLPPDSLLNGYLPATIPDADTLTGISYDVSEKEKITVYPNPNNGEFLLKTHLPIEDDELGIYNMLGQRVKSNIRRQNGSVMINISEVPDGFYFLKIDRGVSSETIKIIKN